MPTIKLTCSADSNQFPKGRLKDSDRVNDSFFVSDDMMSSSKLTCEELCLQFELKKIAFNHKKHG